MSKITQLTENTTPVGTDLIEIVDDPAGTPLSQKSTLANATKALSVMVGDSGSGGTKGLVPAPVTGDATKFLKGNGTWDTPAGGIGGSTGATDNAVLRADGMGGSTAQASAVLFDDNGGMIVPEIVAPATPATGKVVIYAKSDGKLYIKDDTGAETDLTAAGSPSFPLLAPDGSLAAPSYAFTNGADCGVFLVNGTPDHLKVSVGNKEHLDIYQGTGNKPVVLLNLNNDNRLGWGNGLLRSGLADGGKGSVRFISDESGTSGCGFSATADLVDVAGTRRPYHVAGQVFRHVLTGNRTIGPVSADGGSNSISGIIITIILVQDGTGGRTVSWDSSYKWAGGSAPTMTSAANAVDIYRFWCDGSNQAFEVSRSMDVK